MIELTAINQWILDTFHLKQYENIDAVINIFIFITHLGDGVVLGVVAFCLLGWLLIKKHFSTAFLWLAVVPLTFILSKTLKDTFGHARPDDIYHLVEVTSPALPSGHALRSTVVYSLGVMIILSYTHINRSKSVWLIPAIALPFLIGLSRIFLGVHWFADVMLGWVIGGLICFLSGLTMGYNKKKAR